MPDFLTGVIELQILMEGTVMNVANLATPTNVGPYSWSIGNFTLTNSNVNFWFDLLGAGTSTDSPTAYQLVSSGTNVVLIMRLQVQPATAGVDNLLGIIFNWVGNPVITQSQVIVRQVCGVLAATPAQPCPLYQNTSGLVVQPF